MGVCSAAVYNIQPENRAFVVPKDDDLNVAESAHGGYGGYGGGGYGGGLGGKLKKIAQT